MIGDAGIGEFQNLVGIEPNDPEQRTLLDRAAKMVPQQCSLIDFNPAGAAVFDMMGTKGRARFDMVSGSSSVGHQVFAAFGLHDRALVPPPPSGEATWFVQLRQYEREDGLIEVGAYDEKALFLSNEFIPAFFTRVFLVNPVSGHVQFFFPYKDTAHPAGEMLADQALKVRALLMPQPEPTPTAPVPPEITATPWERWEITDPFNFDRAPEIGPNDFPLWLQFQCDQGLIQEGHVSDTSPIIFPESVRLAVDQVRYGPDDFRDFGWEIRLKFNPKVAEHLPDRNWKAVGAAARMRFAVPVAERETYPWIPEDGILNFGVVTVENTDKNGDKQYTGIVFSIDYNRYGDPNPNTGAYPLEDFQQWMQATTLTPTMIIHTKGQIAPLHPQSWVMLAEKYNLFAVSDQPQAVVKAFQNFQASEKGTLPVPLRNRLLAGSMEKCIN